MKVLSFIALGALAAVVSLPVVAGLSSGWARSVGADEVDLVAGCQLKALTAYAVGTPLRSITDGVSGAGANPRLWFQVPGTANFALFDPRSEERSAKTVLSAGDEAAFICVDSAALWARPTGQAPAPAATAVPTGDVRSLMERAVPQVTDMPRDLDVAEDGETFEHATTPPIGPHYFYEIVYLSTLDADEITSQDMWLVSFAAVLFENARQASSSFDRQVDVSPAQLARAVEAGSPGELEVQSLTFTRIDLPGVGDESWWVRVHEQVILTGVNLPAIPHTTDMIAIRRDRMLGLIYVSWAAAPPGTPGRERETRRLAEIMDTNMQAVLPGLGATPP